MDSSGEEIDELEPMGTGMEFRTEEPLKGYRQHVFDEMSRRYVKMAAGRHGNGARESLIRYFDEYLPIFENTEVDHLLAWLWTEGFKIVPIK